MVIVTDEREDRDERERAAMHERLDEESEQSL